MTARVAGGHLFLTRDSEGSQSETPAFCPYSGPDPAPCGEWCPLFGEVWLGVDGSYIRICNAKIFKIAEAK
jgi:hypothetical protein